MKILIIFGSLPHVNFPVIWAMTIKCSINRDLSNLSKCPET
jgi:hypothetical protein